MSIMQKSIQNIEDIINNQTEILDQSKQQHLPSIIQFLQRFQIQRYAEQKQILEFMRFLVSFFYLHQRYQQTLIGLYEKFITQLSEKRCTEINCFVTVLYNMKAYLLLQNNTPLQHIRSILKKVNKYQNDGSICDLSLVSINQNNLAVLYLHDKLYEKSLAAALKGYQNMKNCIRTLKKKKDHKITENIVIFVNSCYLIKEILNKRIVQEQLDTKSKKQYMEYMQLFYNQGFQKAKKYLGTDSYMFKLMEKRHTPIRQQNFNKDLVWKFELPLFKTTSSEFIQQKLKKMAQSLNQRINPKLDSLLSTILKTQETRKTISPLPKPPPPPEPILETNEEVIFEMTKHFIQTKRYSIKVIIYQGRKFRFGKIILQILQSQRSICHQIIQQDLLQTIVQQLCRDCAPYDTNINACSAEEFCEYFLLPFVYVQDGQISIQPHCQGLFQEKVINFLELECYIFVNYIKNNQFRISICPFQFTECLHITVIVQENIMDQILKDYNDNFTEDPKIHNLWKVCKGQDTTYINQKKSTVSECKFTQLQLLEAQIQPIIQGFQKFIKEHQFVLEKPKAIFKHKKKTYHYFKYKIEQFKTGRGCFYGIRNIQKTKTIDVVLQNRHETYSPTGKIKAKGYHCLQYSTLYFEFGVEQCTKYQREQVIQVFAMCSEMFHLHTYEYQLEKDQKQLYGENAIRVSKLIGRVGKRISTIHESESYAITITAQVVTVNSEIPLGVKVTIFSSELCMQNGFFLRCDKRKWLKQKPKDLSISMKQSKASSNRSSASIFSNRKMKQQPPALLNYLFNPILTMVGFDILIKQLQFYPNKQYYGLKETLGNPKFGKLQDFLPIDLVKKQYQLMTVKNQQILNSQKAEKEQISKVQTSLTNHS